MGFFDYIRPIQDVDWTKMLYDPVGAVVPEDKWSTKGALGGAAAGGAAGARLGPWGALGGAAIGTLAGGTSPLWMDGGGGQGGGVDPSQLQNTEQSPYLRQLREQMMQSMQNPLGTGYEQSPLYQDMVRKSQAIMSQRGQAQGARMANQGMLSGGKVGAGRRAGTQAMQMQQDFNVQNRAAAHQAQSRNQLAMIDRQFKMAGFEQGIQDADFQKQYLIMRMQDGLDQRAAQSELDELMMWAGLFDSGTTLAAAGYDAYASGQGAGGDVSDLK